MGRTIDVQSSQMKAGAAGYISSAALLDAANRGVRVRFPLVDIFTTVKDEELAIIGDIRTSS